MLDEYTLSPSWSKLFELLGQDDGAGLFVPGLVVLKFDNGIRVHSERQFIACVRYLQNSMVLNSDVVIFDKRLSS